MHFGLFVARKERKLKQKDVARKLGIHRDTYGRKENGVLDFTLSEAFLLAEMFETTVDELFRKGGDQT